MSSSSFPEIGARVAAWLALDPQPETPTSVVVEHAALSWTAFSGPAPTVERCDCCQGPWATESIDVGDGCNVHWFASRVTVVGLTVEPIAMMVCDECSDEWTAYSSILKAITLVYALHGDVSRDEIEVARAAAKAIPATNETVSFRSALIRECDELYEVAS